jgi:hypothetical protein
MRTLTQIRTPTHPHRNIPSTAPAHQQDAIKTSSLLTLATSHNTDIREAATKMLCTRFNASSSAKKLLVRDLNSDDGEVVHRAQLAYNLLCDMGVMRADDDEDDDDDMDQGALLYDIPAPWRLVESQRGVGDGSERELRRARREAMVVHDSGWGTLTEDELRRFDNEERSE